jgi:hypothetical protein
MPKGKALSVRNDSWPYQGQLVSPSAVPPHLSQVHVEPLIKVGLKVRWVYPAVAAVLPQTSIFWLALGREFTHPLQGPQLACKILCACPPPKKQTFYPCIGRHRPTNEITPTVRRVEQSVMGSACGTRRGTKACANFNQQ